MARGTAKPLPSAGAELRAACLVAFSLTRTAIAAEPADEVVVSVSRSSPVTASSTRVSARELAALPRRTAEDALELVPGLSLVQHGSEGKGHQFFLRGFDAIHGADFAVDVEGVPVNEWSNVHAQGYIDLGFVIPEAITSVEVIKGPFSAEQGAFAMAGSARYQLGVPLSDLGARATYAAGTTNRHRAVVTYSPRAGDGSDFLALEALRDSGFGERRALARGAALGRIRIFDSDARGTLSFLGAAYLARFDLPGALRNEDVESGRVGFYDSYDSRSQGRSQRLLGALHYEWGDERLGLRALLHAGHRQLDLVENFTGFLLDPVEGDRRDQTQRSLTFGADVTLRGSIAETLSLQAGAGVRGDALDQGQDHVDASGAVLDPERSLEGSQALLHARAGLTFSPAPILRVAAGARLDVARVDVRDALGAGARGEGTLSAVSPRASVAVEPWPGLALFAAYGRGFRPPEARAFSSFDPALTGITEDLYDGGEPRMTSTDSFELGARWSTPSGSLGAAASGFATFIERESIYDHVSGVSLELNATRRLGAELELSARPISGLTASADATVADARFVESDNPVPLAPWLIGNLRVIGGGDLGLRGGLRLLAIAPRDLPHGASGSALLSLDGTVGYHWARFRLDAELENLLARALREGEYHYASAWQQGQSASQLPVLHSVAGPPFNVRLALTALF